MERYIEILDTTLRDGAQGEGVVFSREDKIKVIRCLDGLGVDYIEAGNPASNPKDRQFFEFASGGMGLRHGSLVAFGATCRVGAVAAEDPGIMALAGSGAKVISLFGKTAMSHVSRVLKTDGAENLRMIRDSVKALKDRGLKVFFDAEHFFDAYFGDREYALLAVEAAAGSGADRVVLCDTNGGALPGDIERITREMTGRLNEPVGIHCHNDLGLATAGSLAGVSAGAMQVQGTVNGYGERCGNANLCELIPTLMLKLRYRALKTDGLSKITQVAREISEIANITLNGAMPYVGTSAFAHKGGMHIDGVIKESGTFEHIDPALVGNHRSFIISEIAGRGALLNRLSPHVGPMEKDSDEAKRIIGKLKALEAEGYSFEGADGSLILRVLEVLGRRESFFEIEDFHILANKNGAPLSAQAYVKVSVGGQYEITADEGDGPVNALDLAVRKALTRFFPCISQMRLTDYKVRVIDSRGTASAVRVSMESTDGQSSWTTVGVSGNVIEASLIALKDAIDYMLYNQMGK